MQQIDSSTAINGKFVPSTASQKATQLTPKWLNAVQAEILAPIIAAGITPGDDNDQLLQAVRILLHSINDGNPVVVTDASGSVSTTISKDGVTMNGTSSAKASAGPSGYSVEGVATDVNKAVKVLLTKGGLSIALKDGSGYNVNVTRQGLSVLASDGSVKAFFGYDSAMNKYNVSVDGDVEASGSVTAKQLAATGNTSLRGVTMLSSDVSGYTDYGTQTISANGGSVTSNVNMDAGSVVIVATSATANATIDLRELAGLGNIGRKMTFVNGGDGSLVVQYGSNEITKVVPLSSFESAEFVHLGGLVPHLWAIVGKV